MLSPTIIRHTNLNNKIHQVFTYFDNGQFVAVYQTYELCGDRTVFDNSELYSTEEGAISAYLMNVV